MASSGGGRGEIGGMDGGRQQRREEGNPIIFDGCSLGLPVWSLDEKLNVVSWNSVAGVKLGMKKGSTDGLPMLELLEGPSCLAKAQSALERCKMGKAVESVECTMRTPNGGREDVIVSFAAQSDSAGRFQGVAAVGQLYTEDKKQIKEQTRIAQELQAFIDSANAPIFGINSKGLVNEWNDKVAEMTGFTKLEVLNKHSSDVFTSRTCLRAMEDGVRGVVTADLECSIFSKECKRLDVLINVTTRRDISGVPVGCIAVGQDITDRKRVDVEKSELRNFIDTANAPIFGIDDMGRVNEWNYKAAEITGYSREEVLGKDLVEAYITEEFRKSVRTVFQNALNGHGAANFEFPLFTKKGTRVDVLLNATTRRDVTGKIVGVIGVGQDITERKKIEIEKSRVAQELQIFIDTANAPIFGIDASGLVNEWNNKSAEITGFSREEVMGKDLVKCFITDEYRASVKHVLDMALGGRETANFEFPLFTKDKHRVEVLLNATTRRDVTGKPVGVIGVGQDITERKRIEGEKMLVAKELQTFIDTANAPIFGIDAKGLVNEWNNKAAEITGFSRQEVVGKDFVKSFITDEYRTSVREVLTKALHGYKTHNFECPLFTKDQRRVEVLLNATVRRDEAGVAVGVIGVGQDITERKMVEVEKSRVAQELQIFIDTANAPIFGIDASGLVNEWNNKSAEITGFSREEVMGKDLVKCFITDEYRASVKHVLDMALGGRETANFEFPLFTKDKHRVEVLLNATTRRDVTGKPVGVIGVGQDITERKEVEIEKVQLAQELQAFIDTANAPIFGIDTNGKVNEWNNKAAEITGFTSTDVMGRDLVRDFITEEYWESVKSVLDLALQGEETANFELPLYTADKRRVEVLLNATTRRDASGKVVGVIGVGQDITKRKEMENEKTRVAQELQTFIDTANAPIFGIDDGGMVNEWNNKAAEITGFSRKEVMGQDLVKVYISADFRGSVRDVLDNALKGKGTANFEFPLFTKDRRRVEVLLNATPRRDVKGVVVGVIGVGQDITERKEVEMEKARVAQELQTFIETANAPIFGIDANGLVNEWNNKAAEITGFSREDVFGKDLVEVYITEEYRSSVRLVLEDALRGIETANFEFPLFTKDRKRVEVLLNATTRRNVTGKPVGVIGVGQDITTRKMVEEEKARVAQELQTFIDTANAPIFGIDAKGLVNEWNNKAAEITGFSRDMVLGKDLVEVYITDEYRDQVREVLVNALLGNEASNFEFPLYTADKRRVEVLLNATTRRDVTGSIVGVIGVGQDITEKRQLMEQEALLFQAQAANDAKSQFLATMSHEMRTPLNVIMGMNQLVMDTELTAEQCKFTEQIKTSAESLLFLINDILDLTKIEAGKLELVSVEFDLRQIMEEAVDSVASKALGKGLEICCFLSPSTNTHVLGDPDRLRQIFLNLLSNGIKFTHQGQVYILVEIEEVTQTHETFRFKVFDSGIGITEDGQKKLFSRFSQVDSSTTRIYGGTGLGLAISKQFSELMDGSMGVRSNVGKGSLFWFSAVFKRSQSPAKLTAFDPISTKGISLEVIVVADNATLRNSLLRYIEQLKLSVVAVKDMPAAQDMMSKGNGEAFRIIVACPVVRVDDEGMVSNGGGSRRDESLLGMVECLRQMMEKDNKVHTMLLCPITQLSQAASYRSSDKWTVISRPISLSVLYNSIQDVIVRVRAVSGSQLSLPMPQGDTIVEQPAPQRKAKVLVALDDGGQRIVMKAQLCRDGHDVDLCINGGKVWGMIRTQGGDSWAHDIVFLEYNLKDRGACAIAVDIRAEEDRRQAEEIEAGQGDDEPLQKLFVVGVTSKVDPEAKAECMKAGMNTVISKPIERRVIRDIVDKAFEHISTTSPASAENMPIWRKPSASELNRSRSESPRVKSHKADSSANTPTDARTMGESSPAHVENKPFLRTKSGDSRHVKVLVVDDDGGQRIMLKSALVRDGYEVEIAENGIEAIEIVERKRFDVVVMDGMMPSMTGWEATRKIREQEKDKNLVPMIIVGAINSSFPHEANQCIEAGMSTTFSKPLDRAKLIGEISKRIEERNKAGGDNTQRAASNESCASQSSIQSSVAAMSSMISSTQGSDSVTSEAPILASAAETSNPIPTATQEGAAGAASGHPAAKGDGSIPKILVVDDDTGQRLMLKAMLSKDGYAVDTAVNGREMLAMTQKTKYNAVLTDGFMPLMNGWDATIELRKREKEEGVETPLAIIGITGASSQEEIEKGRSSGMTMTITKPIGRVQLRQVIEKYCGPPRVITKTPTGVSPFQRRSSSESSSSARSSAKSVRLNTEPTVLPDFDFKHPPKGGDPDRKMNVLIVDPDSGQKLVLKALLSKMGLAVSVASKGEECLKSMGETGFDVVIIAAEMPEPMSGWQCEAEIRRRESIMFPHDPKVPIVAVVSAKTKDDPKLAETFSAVFSKPFDRNKITATVNELLNGSATGAADPPAAAVASATAAKDSPKLQPIAAAENRGEESSAGAFRAAAADPFRAPSSNKPSPESQSPISLQGRRTRILVVEDHWANRKMLESMLNQQGHELDCVENGVEAVNITGVKEFDLVLMDCNMPIMDGWQATSRIRERKALNATTPIIAVTANAMKGDRDKCIAAGMNDYISKPVERKRLFETISKWVSKADSVVASPNGVMKPTPLSAFSEGPASKLLEETKTVEQVSSAKQVSSTTERSKAKPATKAKQGQEKPTILLVDDDDTLRLLVKSRLEKDNCFVIAAGDGEEALAKFHKTKPDIVISDVFMPKMDGFELCRQIRKHDTTVPIVMLTSMNDVKDRINGLDAGADDYIVKPFAPKELEARVRSLLRRRGAAKEAEGDAGGEGGTETVQSGSSASAHAGRLVGSREVVSKVQALDKLMAAFEMYAKINSVKLEAVANAE